MTKNEAVESLLDWERNEIGYHEQSGNYTKYAADLEKYPNLFWGGSKQGLAWCATFQVDAFVNVFGFDKAIEMLCIPELPCGAAGCLYAVQYYKDAGRWTNQPEPGDQIFFSYSPGEYSHTGIVESVENGKVNTIEGNTSDMVARRSYAIGASSIAGYGRPRWELADGEYVPSPKPSVQPSSPVYTSTILHRGSKGIEVRQMQEKLLKLGYDLGVDGADGDFGRNTYNAVMKFQREHGLEDDGEAGPLTLKAIDDALKDPNAYSGTSDNAPVNSDGKRFFAIGDIVNFKGSVYYSQSNGGSQSYCKSGKALVIGLAKSAKHPYQLCKINGGGSSVYGWVDFNAVEAAK